MRHGVKMAGNFLQQENAVLTGAVEVVIVDVQCIFPAMAALADCFHTKFITTSPKAKFQEQLILSLMSIMLLIQQKVL